MKKTKLAWLKLVAFALPLLALLIFVNIFFDPANIFHDVSRSIADSLLAGNPTYITSGNMDERTVKQYIMEGMPEHVECVVVGPSVAFGIRTEQAGTDSFYNLSVSGADFYDILAQFGILHLNNKTTGRVIFNIDPYFFSDSVSDSSVRSVPLRPYADYMISVLNGETPEMPERDSRAENLQKFYQMFSVTFFQASVDYIVSNKTLDIPRWGVADDDYDGSYYLPDCSMIYPDGYSDTTAEEVIQHAAEYPRGYHFAAGEHISTSKVAIFEKLMDYLQAQGTEVTFYLAPMSPSLWALCDDAGYPLIREIENYILQFSEGHNCTVVGSYNPGNYGIVDEDFYDSRHLKHERLDKYFDFK